MVVVVVLIVALVPYFHHSVRCFLVVHVTEDSTLLDVVRDNRYDFCMCNPPFYGSNLEAWGWLTTRKDAKNPRAEPTSVSTASPIEGITPGGEIQFVRERIIESSVELQSRVRYLLLLLLLLVLSI